jgi:hypothetical protein
LTVKDIVRLVFPFPVVLFTKLTVSEYDPAARLLAWELMETVTVVLAPAANVPLLSDKLTQFWLFPAVQLNEEPPVFERV